MIKPYKYLPYHHATTQVSTLAGSGIPLGFLDGAALSSQFRWLDGVAADAGGNIFVADYNNNAIRRIDWSSRMVSTVAGNGTSAEIDGVGTATSFISPYGLAISNDSIWVADSHGGTVRRIGINSDILFHFTNLQIHIKPLFDTVLSCPVIGTGLHDGSLCDGDCAVGYYFGSSNVCLPCPLGY